ncbi:MULTISPECIES: protein kinase [Actinoplanes]|uniref:protein kinase domain-containing protein n=1 Tax=Actinoplanes TaxID=1865 RepID=UPI0006969ED4|nr:MULTISPECIES: protein kinase [Actinoplanes]GLY02321.1 hypothetical protein Acsp01_27000 [Actinoplanes sp. NBRC 101535]
MVGRLGEGGMGVVYLARSRDGERVAVKLIHSHLASDAEFRGRFRGEVQRARQAPAFCTARFLGADLDHDPPYLVVEYVDGPSLAQVVARQGPLEHAALRSLAVGTATALTGIHSVGIIHRDLKPGNVLLALGGPKVIDFGIARPFEATSRHTRTDMMVGTITYMAPELFSDDPASAVTAAADVFAWGCLVTYAATGRTPFRGESPQATVARILSRPPRVDGIAEFLREPVLHALAKDPADRPTAPELLAMMVNGHAAGSVATARPRTPKISGQPARPRRGGHARPAAVAAAGLLTVAGLIGATIVANGEGNAQQRAAPPGSSASVAPTGSAPAGATRSEAGSSAPARVRKRTPSPSAGTGSAAPATPRTEPASSAPDGSANPSGRNLALGTTATASSAEGDRWSAGQAVDGDPETRWGSAFSDPQWLQVDLGRRWRIRRIEIDWERAYAVAYRVEVSEDAATWTTVHSTSSGQGGNVTITVDDLTGRYVRVSGTRRAGDYGYSVYELKVF